MGNLLVQIISITFRKKSSTNKSFFIGPALTVTGGHHQFGRSSEDACLSVIRTIPAIKPTDKGRVGDLEHLSVQE